MEWISVKDKLPEEYASVITFDPSRSPMNTVNEGFFANGEWDIIRKPYMPKHITHWMPLPSPPIDND
jgi:hypothetical protein